MLSIGIIWNTGQQFKEEIIQDINSRVNVIDFFDMDLHEKYVEFINMVYSSENMEQSKIDIKTSNMILNNNTNITVIFFEFDDRVIEYHPFKKKNVYKQLEDCKRYIREKYKQFVDNYVFDIIFHATDDLNEFLNCYNVLLLYLNNYIKEKEAKHKVLKLTKLKSLNLGGNVNERFEQKIE